MSAEVEEEGAGGEESRFGGGHGFLELGCDVAPANQPQGLTAPMCPSPRLCSPCLAIS
jgi:hypothetical protein